MERHTVFCWDSPPCDGCANASACASRELACGEFAAFVNNTHALKRFGKIPSKEWFELVFDPGTDDKKVEAALLTRAKDAFCARARRAA